MSTGNPQAVMFGETIAAEMAAMRNSSAAFEADMSAARDKEKEMMAQVWQGYANARQPQISQEAMRIAKLIDQNPLLLMAVGKFVHTKLQEMSEAASKVFGISPEDIAPK